jgi:hypothetical protein
MIFEANFQANFPGFWSIRAQEIAQGRPQRGDFDGSDEFSQGLQEF